ncbi:uncharacterized protein N7483_013160 [Penicillium malachiteum]|uniref:uncharacterized protein n=1 Tax=Penicillium malachiteum TaxID=1324776 RepID=UPI00254768C9|nr:uncharacterized protein N7483_013160 [Penicillium malachiteum]KAJ5715979.1 hypothetical protein N7483_013160 [Penicillium malachiteum]
MGKGEASRMSNTKRKEPHPSSEAEMPKDAIPLGSKLDTGCIKVETPTEEENQDKSSKVFQDWCMSDEMN